MNTHNIPTLPCVLRIIILCVCMLAGRTRWLTPGEGCAGRRGAQDVRHDVCQALSDHQEQAVAMPPAQSMYVLTNTVPYSTGSGSSGSVT
jgi:hypothetical protein